MLIALVGTAVVGSIQGRLARAPASDPPRRLDVDRAHTETAVDACTRGHSRVESGWGQVWEAEAGIEPALLQQACELAGETNCGPAQMAIIPRETALCVAEQVLAGTGRAPRAVLGWHTGAGQAVWTVIERPVAFDGEDGPDDCGQRMIVAAETGRVLGVQAAGGC